MKKAVFPFILFILFLFSGPCLAGEGFLLLSSTIGPIDSGIVALLEDRFEQDTGIRVRHVGAGTGAALNIAKKGNVDLVMVHAKSLEEKFIKDGYGTKRIPFMYNDFVIVGPATDPAGIKGMKKAAEALRTISAKGAPFVSRGDKSGTHVAELVIWDQAGIKPAGAWYKVYEKGSEGNVATLKYADQQKSYTFIDRATYLGLKKDIKLAILVEGDEALLNFISLIPLNPQKLPKANTRDAATFIAWMTSPEKGQLIVRDFGKDKYGSPLFFPNSDEWNKKK